MNFVHLYISYSISNKFTFVYVVTFKNYKFKIN